MPNKKILVIGATGFIGGALFRRLQLMGYEVSGISKTLLRSNIFQIDLRDLNAVSGFFKHNRFDIVFNCSGRIDQSVGHHKYLELCSDLLVPTLNIIEEIHQNAPDTRFVHVGTNAEYGNAPVPHGASTKCEPNSAYGSLKLAATEAILAKVRSEGLNAVVARPFLVFGSGAPKTNFVEIIIRSIQSGVDFPTTHGEQTRDFIEVSHVLDQLINLGLEVDVRGEVVNICSGCEIRIKDMLLAVQKEFPCFNPRFGMLSYRNTEIMRSVGLRIEPATSILPLQDILMYISGSLI
jgi:nucleoside-diphosphate-sugar epimerase